MSRGDDRREIFLDHIDYTKYLQMLEHSAQRFGVEVIAYCLMPNHLHLLVKPHQHPLSRLMHHVNSAYCGWFNRRHGRVGHVLQGRYKAQIVEGGPALLRAARYIMRNPVAAGKTAHAAEWPYSSLAQMVGPAGGSSFVSADDVLQIFDSTDRPAAQRRFMSFVDGEAAAEAASGNWLVGSDSFIRGFANALHEHRTNREFVHAQRFAARPPLIELIPCPTRGPTLRQAAHSAFHTYAFTLREIGDHVGASPSTIWIWAQRARAAA